MYNHIIRSCLSVLLGLVLLFPSQSNANKGAVTLGVAPDDNTGAPAATICHQDISMNIFTYRTKMILQRDWVSNKSTPDVSAVFDSVKRPLLKPFTQKTTTNTSTAEPTQPTAPVETEPIHTHSYTDTIVNATCTQEGYTIHECVCGESYTDNIQAKLAHKYEAEIIAPTTASGGYTLHTCGACGDAYTDCFTEPIPQVSTDIPLTQDTDHAEYAGDVSHESHYASDGTPETEKAGPSELDNAGTGSSCYTGGGGTPETEDYGFCPYCGIRIWTTWYPSGCFTFLEDTVCDCGVLVHAWECHHH